VFYYLVYMVSRFCRYELRTTDVGAAQTFYAHIFGAEWWGSGVLLSALSKPALARGARPHWLGHVGVGDVEGTTARLLELGAEQLGPLRKGSDASTTAVLRDPFAALVAVSSDTAAPERSPVAWHILHTEDHERAFAAYASLFGWTATEALDLGERGRYQVFTWDSAGKSVGSVADTARLPGIHPQWLFFFPVADIEAARAKVQASGGVALDTMKTPSGNLAAPCDDPQGAAFGLYQFAPA
jgi:predicted enzyme related to lactoylglutathione lyase